jgi:UDP-N-acetyl-D-glucosamine dehydrogenase
MAKLLENSFRFINITFINELAIYCEKTGVDIRKVIEAASTKPYGFMPFYPSVGVGGHCIPVDPLYLANAARVSGTSLQMIELARNLNQSNTDFILYRAEKKVGKLDGKNIIVIGVAYKPNVSDTRESAVTALIQGLKRGGANVFWHDDLVKEWNGEKSTSLSKEFDLAIIATLHDYIDLTKLGEVKVVDTRNSL